MAVGNANHQTTTSDSASTSKPFSEGEKVDDNYLVFLKLECTAEGMTALYTSLVKLHPKGVTLKTESRIRMGGEDDGGNERATEQAL